jgi:Large polyvalent protein-associated domain 7
MATDSSAAPGEQPGQRADRQVGKDEPAAKLTARDAVVGVAHAAQLTAPTPEVQAAVKVVVAADAAVIATDVARGKDVRPLDVATSAAGVTLASGIGGATTQAAAKGVAAVGIADGVNRAGNTIDELERTQQRTSAQEQESLSVGEQNKRWIAKQQERMRQDDGPQLPNGKKADKEREDDTIVLRLPDLSRKYLKAGDAYYFREDHTTLAFSDEGKRLHSTHDDAEVARSMVHLAVSKGWHNIKLNGSEQFKREAWLEASLRGLAVEGYEPKAPDKARLAELATEQMAARANADRSSQRNDAAQERSDERASNQPTPSQQPQDKQPADERRLTPQQATAVEALRAILKERGDSDKEISAAVSLATERFQNQRAYVGRLVEHGQAPYEFDKKNEGSYYARLATPQGEKVVWGVDIQRAIAESKAQKGDDIALAFQGTKPVTVAVKDRDADGNVIGTKNIETHRNAWAAEKVEKIQEAARQAIEAAATRTAQQPVVKVFDPAAPRPAAPQADRPPPQRQQERGR